MTDASLVARASRKLELRDIALHAMSLQRQADIDPCLYPLSVESRSEIKTETEQLSFLDKDDEKIPVLRAFVELTLSGFEAGQDEEETLLFTVCAEYRVDYTIRDQLEDDEIQAFSEYNAVHNIWPFWRQHVSQTLSQANLPRITIPFFRQPPGQPKVPRGGRKIPDRKEG